MGGVVLDYFNNSVFVLKSGMEKKAGRPHRYPEMLKLEIGQHVEIPGGVLQVRRAAYHLARKMKWNLRVETEGYNPAVRRLPYVEPIFTIRAPGRPFRYPEIYNLEVGETVMIPFIRDERGFPINDRWISTCCYRLQSKYGYKFVLEAIAAGVAVRRIG